MIQKFIQFNVIFLLLLAVSSAVHGQRLTRSEIDRDLLHIDNPIDYENYGLGVYTLYPSFSRRVPRYDRMGNYLLLGELGYAVDESRPGLSRLGGIPRGYVYISQIILNYAVIRDSYRGIGYSLIVNSANPEIETRQLPEGVRTRFSPLILNMARYAGVRFDIHGSRNQSTFLYSRGSGLRKRFSFFTPGRNEKSPVILWGGHWQSTIGAPLRLGTTFVNQHLSDATSREGSIFHGNIPYNMKPPKTVYVRVTDDSPDDPRSVAAVYSVSVILNGVDANGKARRVTDNPDLAGPGIEVDPFLKPVISGRRVGDRYEASGKDEKVEFGFTTPKDFRPSGAEFVAVVAGDYRVGIRQVHDFLAEGSTTPTQSSWPSTARANQFERPFLTSFDPRYPTDFKFPEKDPVYTVLRSDGNPHDVSQRKTVRFTYGMPVAQSLSGFDFSLRYRGYTLDGDVAFNVQDFKFPVREGRRSDKRYLAYFLTGSGEISYLPYRVRPQVGAEVFDLPAAYSGGYDAKRGGAIFFTEVAGFPPGALTQEFNLYDDNDDGDQWPDDLPDDGALSGANDAGVFPGLDEDRDNVIDTDRNVNGKPDWTEPFLFYDSDPPEFIYDVDFNNNDLPDITENDDEADYPYRRGQRGYHAFVNFPRLTSTIERLAFGYHRAEEPLGGGESVARYARLEVRYLHPIGRIVVKNIVKKVEDGIPDPSYIWKVSEDPSVNMLVVQSKDRATLNNLLAMVPPQADPLIMRNSTVNTFYLGAHATPLTGVSVQSRDKFTVNRQHAANFADGSGQKSHTLYRWTLSNRAEYTRRITKDLSLAVKGKHLFRWDRGYPEEPAVRFSTVGPIAEVTFKATSKLQLLFGQEGWPLLPFRYTDFSNEANNFRQWTTLFLVRTDWSYWGWLTTLEMGMEWQSLRKAGKDLGERTLFVETYVGF
ncbi:MAG: hypothetical protein HY709_12015 [Candidatus Latescibacteria bacterium]|nr:hypothetical protein [Candidatus Latescibacterota bacterium]